MRYTKEFLGPLVKRNISVAGIMRELGFRNLNGGTHGHITRAIQRAGVDASHFLGQRANSGKHHKGNGPTPWKDVLVNRPGVIRRRKQAHRCLQESGREYVCDDCGQPPVWRGKPLVIQIDHINGNRSDARPSNLKYRCPNCHSQTETWGNKGAGG